MTKPSNYTHFAWAVSPYSAKTRAYLQFKGVPFKEVAPSLPGLMFRIKRAVGRPVMPTVRCPDGRWLQDSSLIIDTLEDVFPDRPVIPSTPNLRLACLLLELHADEWFPIVIMHTRWNTPTNADFARREFAREGLPWFPAVLARRLTRPLADQMASYRPVLGATRDTAPGIETFLRDTIATLQGHFDRHPFLFGSRPSLADFALFGPLWAHVYRDPGSRHYFDAAPTVVQWMQRLQFPQTSDGSAIGEFLDDDAVPESLTPLFERMFAEQFPYLENLVAAVDRYYAERPDQTHVPRSLGDTSFTIGGAPGTRRLLTFSQWMLQRAHGVLDGSPRQTAWLKSVGGEGLAELGIAHPFEMREFKLSRERPNTPRSRRTT